MPKASLTTASASVELEGYEGHFEDFGPYTVGFERYSADGIREDPLLYFFIDRYAESYARELNDFVTALDERRAPSIGFTDGRRALLIAEAAVASAKSGAPVAIPG